MKSVERIKEYFEIEEIQEERHNQAYEGCLFSIDQHLFRNRFAKKTPKKKGYFVVFWEKIHNSTIKPILLKNHRIG